MRLLHSAAAPRACVGGRVDIRTVRPEATLAGAECWRMSMIAEYVRLRPHEFIELQRLLLAGPEEACDYASDLQMGNEEEEVSPRGIDTDKAWAALQYLLAKAGTPVDIIFGGEPLSDDIWAYDRLGCSAPQTWPKRPASLTAHRSYHLSSTMTLPS